MQAGRATIISGFVAAGFWLLESVIHYEIFEHLAFELLPSDPNELWMRSAMCATILLLGINSDRHSRRILEKEREKHHIFRATVRSSQHVLNNLLNQMQYFMLHAEDEGLIKDEVKQLYAQSIEESTRLLKNLGSLGNPCAVKIKKAVEPWQPAVSDTNPSGGNARVPE
ncbi:MAG: hypothetical protein OEZ23_05760 [Gammaproteobacteria bacterium]|nr:hypothetical protein [Gammaproteobacteria bacterium]